MLTNPSETRPARRLPIATLLVANTVSLIGEMLTAIAIPWYVYETTGSAAQMGVVGFFSVLPRVLAMFFGGPIVDRAGYKTTSVTADVLSGLSVAAIPLLHQTVGLTFPLLIVLVFLGGIFDGPGATARESLVPDLARLGNVSLERVNTIYQTAQRLALLLGPALAGILITLLGTSNVLLIDAATFGISALALGIAVPRRRVARAAASEGRYWRDLGAGLDVIRRDQLLLWIVIVLALLNFLDAPLGAVLLPVFARAEFGGVEALGTLLSAAGAGAVTSSLLFAAIGGRLSRYRTFVVSFLLVSLPYWVLTTVPSFPVAVAALFAMGGAAGPINPILMTVAQERVPEAMRGRAFGAGRAIAWTMIPLGQLLGGVSVELAGTRATFAIIAVCYTGIMVTMLFIPALRGLERSPARATASLPSQSEAGNVTTD